MKELFIVMAILGCGDGNAPCETLRTVDAGFRTMAACNAASPAVLTRLDSLDYPVVVAQCRQRSRIARLERHAPSAG